jgi:hypothetical protein
MELSASSTMEVGRTASVTVTLTNVSSHPLTLVKDSGDDARCARVALFAKGRRVMAGGWALMEPLYPDFLVRLAPGESRVSVYRISPAVAGLCTLNAGLANNCDTVIRHNVPVLGPDGKTTITRCCESVRMPGIWKGDVGCWLLMDVKAASREAIEEAASGLSGGEMSAREGARTLSSMLATPSELASQVVLRYAASLPRGDSLRSYCLLSVMDMVLGGVGVERIPELLDEVMSARNPQRLRLELLAAFAEILGHPRRSAQFLGNDVSVTVDEAGQKAIRTSLERLSNGPDPRIAEAARSVLAKR